MTTEEKYKLLTDTRYKRAAKYDPKWLLDNAMGSPCLQLVDALSDSMDLKPGMRVLDLGCGNALTSIFLAKEYGVFVWAVDLWVDPSQNWERIKEAGVEKLVFPIYANAYNMPFAKNFFDAVIGINSFQFFATANTFLADHLAPLVRNEGQMGLMIFGPQQEFHGPVPEHLANVWWPDFYYFHSPDWWKWHIEQTKLFTVEAVDDINGDGNRLAVAWETIMDKLTILRGDKDKMLSWWRMVVRRNEWMPDDLRISVFNV